MRYKPRKPCDTKQESLSFAAHAIQSKKPSASHHMRYKARKPIKKSKISKKLDLAKQTKKWKYQAITNPNNYQAVIKPKNPWQKRQNLRFIQNSKVPITRTTNRHTHKTLLHVEKTNMSPISKYSIARNLLSRKKKKQKSRKTNSTKFKSNKKLLDPLKIIVKVKNYRSFETNPNYVNKPISFGQI